MNQPPHATSSLGKWMIFIGFALGLFLLTQVFDNEIEKQINPNQHPDSTRNNQGVVEVRLKRNRFNHYVTNGEINNQQVTFLLDTGATSVSVPEDTANRIGLRRGPAFLAQTANGTVTVYHTVLQTLAIGDILLYDVPANINPHMQDQDILLGMSALKDLEFTQRGNTLILRQL